MVSWLNENNENSYNIMTLQLIIIAKMCSYFMSATATNIKWQTENGKAIAYILEGVCVVS